MLKREFNHYNPEDKKEFLSLYDKIETSESYGYILEKIASLEEFYSRDLYDFNMDQIEEAMYLLKPSSLAVSRMNGAVLAAYISWAIDTNKIISNMNPIKNKVNAKDWYRKFIDPSRKNYISLEELEDIESSLINSQDKVVPRLLFEGVGGVFVSEVLNLKEKDVKEEKNKLRLNDDRKGERYITVSKDCIKLINSALKAKDYEKKNGDSGAKNPTLELVNNDYVIKTAGTNAIGSGRADKHTIYRRVAMISKALGVPYFTTKSIQRSGMIYMAYNLMKTQGKSNIDRSIIIEVAQHFGVTKVADSYNFSLLEEYINLENIKELYDI